MSYLLTSKIIARQAEQISWPKQSISDQAFALQGDLNLTSHFCLSSFQCHLICSDSTLDVARQSCVQIPRQAQLEQEDSFSIVLLNASSLILSLEHHSIQQL